jgi:hypothetical protein
MDPELKAPKGRSTETGTAMVRRRRSASQAPRPPMDVVTLPLLTLRRTPGWIRMRRKNRKPIPKV